MSAPSQSARSCGACSLCCTVLRVDELKKLGGVNCQHQYVRGDASATGAPERFGCAIHQQRPQICRAYHCLWVSGGLTDADRPDRLGAVVDILTSGAETRLSIQESRPGAFDASTRLQEIAAQHRESMPVRVVEAGNFLDPDRVFRVLLAGGEEHRVKGEWTTLYRPGTAALRQRLPLLARMVRRTAIWIRARKIAKSVDPPRDNS